MSLPTPSRWSAIYYHFSASECGYGILHQPLQLITFERNFQHFLPTSHKQLLRRRSRKLKAQFYFLIEVIVRTHTTLKITSVGTFKKQKPKSEFNLTFNSKQKQICKNIENLICLSCKNTKSFWLLHIKWTFKCVLYV